MVLTVAAFFLPFLLWVVGNIAEISMQQLISNHVISCNPQNGVNRRCLAVSLLPTKRCSGCLSCFVRVLDLLAKELLEVLGQHAWRTSFDNLADLGTEANAAEARQASHAGQHDIDDQPFDVIVCTPRHDEVSN